MNTIRIKSFLFPAAAAAAYGLLFLVNRSIFNAAVETAVYGTREMLAVIPPIFILLGLLDVWVPRHVLTRFMGEGSGVKGTAVAFIMGSAAAGPLYGAFPVASVLMKKGASFFNVMVFIGAWSTTKIPMFLFEIQALGAAFALTRLAVNIPGIIIIARLLQRLISRSEQEQMYLRAQAASD